MSKESHILPHFIVRGLNILKNEGLIICLYKIRQRSRGSSFYKKWITEKEREEQAVNKEELEYRPLISVLVPVYNTEKKYLTDCIESVLAQDYDNWQLCLADDCSTVAQVKEVLGEYENNDRIDICYRDVNGHISKATNSALDMARGDYIALLDCDDVLAPNALYEVVKVLNENRNIKYIYTDEDKFCEDMDSRNTPHFKADWSPDTLMSYMYTCHLSVFNTSIVRKLGGYREGYEGAQDYDMVLRYTEQIDKDDIYHIPKILYHWRTHKGSTSVDASEKNYILEAVYKAKKEALARRNINAELEYIEELGGYRVNYIPEKKEKISVIIPSKDNAGILRKCVQSIRSKTLYDNYEIIIIDNGSSSDNKKIYEKISGEYNCTYYYEQMEFNFSRMCNKGAEIATGSYFLFLNDDIEVIGGEWLQRMLGQASLKYVGAVGAKLLYPGSNLIQHTGVINIASGPSHALCGYSDDDVCAFARNLFDFNYSAVTAACMMISADIFNEAGRFDESMAVSYNDVELCFRLIEMGYYNVVRNDVVLYHYESFSRGYDLIDSSKMKRLSDEKDRLYDIHPEFAPSRHMDPFYNENLTQNCLDFSCNYDNIGNYLSGCSKKRLSYYREDDRIIYKIDNFTKKDGLNINGWAYLDNSFFKNIHRVKILVINNKDEVYEYDTIKIYRPDVGSIIHKKRMYMIGFQCSSDKLYDDAEYAIAIGRKMRYIS